MEARQGFRGVRKSVVSRTALEWQAIEGDSPVGESVRPSPRSPEYCRARGTRHESGGTTLQGYILVRDR